MQNNSHIREVWNRFQPEDLLCSWDQHCALTNTFMFTPYPNSSALRSLAKIHDISLWSIRDWFDKMQARHKLAPSSALSEDGVTKVFKQRPQKGSLLLDNYLRNKCAPLYAPILKPGAHLKYSSLLEEAKDDVDKIEIE